MAKTGERKAQILQTLAAMLEDPKGERITTALLAARLEVSEAALYRHFASKAQMFEGLIEFIEQTVFTLVNKIQVDEKDAMKQIETTIATLLGFAQKNPGMTRVLTGDALVNEDERLQSRVNQLLDRLTVFLKFLLPQYVAEGKSYVTVGIGCTGGRHRSVYVAEALRRATMGQAGVTARVRHRDVGREGRVA